MLAPNATSYIHSHEIKSTLHLILESHFSVGLGHKQNHLIYEKAILILAPNATSHIHSHEMKSALHIGKPF